MFRKIHCDWFLSDGIFLPTRLDAPMFVEDALVSCGRIRADMTNLEHIAVEWMYRRAWTYFTEFEIPDEKKRTFMRISSLRGNWHVLFNGAEAARGSNGSAVFEVSANMQKRNRLEIRFDPDTSAEMRPVVGFGGMLSFRQTGEASITKLNITEDAQLFAALDMQREAETELRISVKNSTGKHESTTVQKLAFGYTPLVFDEMSAFLASGETNEVTLEVSSESEQSDMCTLTAFLSEESVQPRGFVAESEELIGLGEKAGALAAFTLETESDFSHRQLCARHALESLSAESLLRYLPPPTVQPLDRLIALAGTEEQLENHAFWLLAGSDRQCLDVLKPCVPSGDIAKLIALSRYQQAVHLQEDALEARLNDQYFVIDSVGSRPSMPASSSLMDVPGHMRPAYYALMAAWQSEVGYTKSAESEQNNGIVTCDVFYVSDGGQPAVDAVSVDIYDMNGNKCVSNSFPALTQGRVGRFTFELPESGAAIARTSLVKGEESLMSTDEVILHSGRYFEELPLTQLLAEGGKITNVGTEAALGVCVPGAVFFGCLLPGEYVTATQGDPDEAEGLNIFI